MSSPNSFGRRNEFVVEVPYIPTEGHSLFLQIGDVLKDVEKLKGEFWKGRLKDCVGYFPKTHVKELRLSDIIFQSNRTCRVIYDFEPSTKMELRLQAGDEVQVLEEAGLGWWRGRLGDKVGVFPASHIIVCNENLSAEEEKRQSLDLGQIPCADSPVQLRPRSTRNSAAHMSLDQVNTSALKLSPHLFDPEDEPAVPLYDSSLEEIHQNVSSSTSTGIFQKIRNSFDGSVNFGRRRNSSTGTYLETQSTCSPALGRRRRSFASFFRRKSSSSKSLDPSYYTDTVYSAASTSEMKKSFTSLGGGKYTTKPRGWRSKDSEESLSWVYEETRIKAPGRVIIGQATLDSGCVDCDGPFGPVDELSDEVFNEMFGNAKDENEVLKNVPEDAILESNSSRPRSKIKTTTGRFNFPTLGSSQNSGKRTNPFVFWKPKEKVKTTDI